MKRAFASLLVLAALAAPLHPAEVPARFISPAKAGSPASLERWWTRFQDPELNRLVETALAASPDVMSADARLREARARKLETAARWWPTLAARGAFLREEFSETGRTPIATTTRGQDLYQAALDASWEIDVFGRTRHAVAAAGADISAASEDRRAVLLSLSAEVADGYLELRGLQQRRAVVRHNVSAQEEILSLTRERVRAGLSPGLVESQSEALMAETRAALPELEEAIRQTIHRLAFLCGQTPGWIAPRLEKTAKVPVGPPEPAPGTPAALLRRRPDIRRAELQLAAATARIAQARADRYPRLRIAARGGYESRESARFAQRENLDWNAGPELSFPLFTGGEITARIRQREAARDQERATYDNALLRAVADVEDALVAVRQRRIRLGELAKAETSHRQSLADAQNLFKAGGTDFLNVLDAQRAVLTSQERVAIAEADAARAKVRLFKALGGGW